jgi:2-polyprenyl-6-hydroxyphenyl methylase/3-demethylubiquinone-9 3-methyltransferase
VRSLAERETELSRGDYYSEKLSAERLRMAYEIAPPRVSRYLEAEIEFVLDFIDPGDAVLELGCGYGRVLKKLLERTHNIVGIDTAMQSLRMAPHFVGPAVHGRLFAMNAAALGFQSNIFHGTFCLQNGISAFGVDALGLMREAQRVTRPGGLAVFSSYSQQFWPDRLQWFRLQAEQGLLGEIDEEATGKGVIVCKDGFRATTIGPDGFRDLSTRLGVSAEIVETEQGSVMCTLHC